MKLEKKSTIEIIDTMSKLEKEIDLKTLKVEKLKLELYQLQQELAVMIPEYEELRVEIVGRFPNLENSNEFKPKQSK